MKIILSPAKLMDVENTLREDMSEPQFLENSQNVMDVLKQLKPLDLTELMKISNALADMNYLRNKDWSTTPSETESGTALFSFRGEVYKGINKEEHTIESLAYLQKNALLLSGLYGILKPLDQILPYRLEMGSKLAIGDAKNLYEHWQPILTPYLDDLLEKDELILNLASIEYSKAIDLKSLNRPIVSCHFKNYRDGELKNIMVYFKKGRGMMARYCADNNVQTVEEIKAFDLDSYRFEEGISDERNLVFTR